MTLLEKLREIVLQTSAEDGCLDLTTVPREWREEAMFWQSSFSDDDLLRLFAAAREDRQWDSVWEACRVQISEAHARSWCEEQQRREDEALDQRLAVVERVNQLAEAVEAALGVTFRQAGGGSWYARLHGLKLRVSDHEQVEGGGWSEERQARMGEADLEWIADAPDAAIPSRQAIRDAVAAALRAARREE